MGWYRKTALLVGLGVIAGGAVRHFRGSHLGNHEPGGVLIDDVKLYDGITRVLMGSFFDGVASNVAEAGPEGGRVLEVGCGPGHLSTRLAGRGLDVTGVDLDPAMIERAQSNAARSIGEGRAVFQVGDVAALPFPDESFDLVVSTLSMHHWDDPKGGLTEIGRVLAPDGRALIWDLRPGIVPGHHVVADPVQVSKDSNLMVSGVTPWSWPWSFSLMHRFEIEPRLES